MSYAPAPNQAPLEQTMPIGLVGDPDQYADLKKAISHIAAKRERQSELIAYYDGTQNAIYLSSRIRSLFDKVGVRFHENWCSVVIDSLADRIQLEEFTIADNEAAQEEVSRLWRLLRLGVDADDLHQMALIAGEAFLIIGPEPLATDDGEPLDAASESAGIVACYHDPRLCYVCYDSENPKRKKFAAKCWIDVDAALWRLTLYYPDRFVYYQATFKQNDLTLPGVDAWRLVLPTAEYPDANPWGMIPVFHFRNKRDRSDLDNVIPLQDGINKLVIDMLVAAGFQAIPQRYVISNAETRNLKNAPDEIWDIPASDGQGQPTSVGQFSAADLQNFFGAIDNLVNAISSISRTPKHYFTAAAGELSGEALIAMEAPLNKKAQDRIERFSPEWRPAIAFLARLAGHDVPVEDIEPVFTPVETVQPYTEAQVRQLDTSTGIPLKTVLRRSGWSDSELEQLDKDKSEADEAAQATFEAQAKATAQFTGGTDNGEDETRQQAGERA
jgi:hypothetical protein